MCLDKYCLDLFRLKIISENIQKVDDTSFMLEHLK